MKDQLHIDMATLEMLQEVLEGGFAGLLETYMEDSSEKVECLKAGMSQADSDLVRRSAHSLKGSSSNLGANALAELCLNVEQQAREANLEGLEEVVSQIEAEHQAVVGIMKDIRDSL